MERAAFKCTREYVEVLGGKDSELYEEFVVMFTKGLAAARKYATVTVTMMEIMMFQVRADTDGVNHIRITACIIIIHLCSIIGCIDSCIYVLSY